MATWRDVRRLALAFPGASESSSRDNAAWTVNDKFFVWERPLRKSDVDALGAKAPKGPILGVRTSGLEMKEALIASKPGVFFTTPHFDGYPAVLVRLDKIDVKDLKELILEAWFARAPKKVVDAFQKTNDEKKRSATRGTRRRR